MLVAAIKERSPHDFAIQSVTPVSGGDINRAYRIRTGSANYFVKTNDVATANAMFLAESSGLAQLRRTPGVKAPKTCMVGNAHGEAFLLMEWLDQTEGEGKQGAAQEALGRMVAHLHRQQSDTYGLDHDNFIGRLPQVNTPTADWTTFFIEHRLRAQLQRANREWLDGKLQARFDQLIDRLDTLYPSEPPSLVHGDLWGGNYVVTAQRQPVLIDPAIYYGHREVDLAMTHLFGGFTHEFYAAYHETYPMAPGWEQRVDLWNLYPLLVHLNLFGPAYLEPIRRSLRQYL